MIENYNALNGTEEPDGKVPPQGESKRNAGSVAFELSTRVNVHSNKFASLEKPLRGITCCMLGRTSPLRRLMLRVYYSRLRKLVTVLLIFSAGTLVGFVFSTVQTTGESAGYRNALEREMGTQAFDEFTLTVGCLPP